MAARLRASWKVPRLVEPSPKNETETFFSPRYLAANAAPVPMLRPPPRCRWPPACRGSCRRCAWSRPCPGSSRPRGRRVRRTSGSDRRPGRAVPVAAVAGDDVVVLGQHRHDPCRDGFLAAVEMQESRHAPLEEGFVRVLLERADAHHAAIEVYRSSLTSSSTVPMADLPVKLERTPTALPQRPRHSIMFLSVRTHLLDRHRLRGERAWL